MVDRVSPEKRSANMAAVKNKNTTLEKSVRTRIFANGFRYRLHDKKLPGSPDLTFRKYRLAVFIHGCFWHGHNCKKGKRPCSNKEFWDQKLDINIARDLSNLAILKSMNWEVITIWECSIEKGITELLDFLYDKKSKDLE